MTAAYEAARTLAEAAAVSVFLFGLFIWTGAL
jgi:hypothetical protein